MINAWKANDFFKKLPTRIKTDKKIDRKRPSKLEDNSSFNAKDIKPKSIEIIITEWVSSGAIYRLGYSFSKKDILIC